MKLLRVQYKPSFLRQFKKLERALQKEAAEKIELFKNTGNHHSLDVHKLKGRLAGHMVFSINYRYRIVFEYIDAKTVGFLAIGDHDIYK